MNVLIVRNDKLGDFITALPACYILKQHLPDAHISALISPINASIADACDFIDDVIVDHGQSTKELSNILKKKNFDLSITLFSNTRVAIAQWLAGIPKRVAPATKFAQIFYNNRIIQRRSQVKMAEFEYNIQLVVKTFPSIDTNFPKPLLPFADEEKQSVFQTFCKQLDITKKVIAFHPGFGGSSDANWNIMEYIEMAMILEAREDLEIVFTFGPGDESFLQAFHHNKGDLKAKVYESKESVLEFAKLISSFKLFVSTSTGTFHLASLVGTPTMTFFADSLFASSKRWKGIGDINLQHNIMIPQEPELRKVCFEQVKKDLLSLV